MAMEVDLHLPQSHSLKDKRAIIRPILDGARHRYRVAASEVAFQDRWQRALLGFAAVGGEDGHPQKVMAEVDRFVWSFPEVEVLNIDTISYDWND